MVFDLIRRFDGDFVGIQEAWPDQVADMRRALPEYDFVGRSREADPSDGEATPLLYRRQRWKLDPQEQDTFWLSSTPKVPGSRAWWSVCPRIVTWGRFIDKTTGRAVYVYNTHFCHLSGTARRESAVLLASRIAHRRHTDPVIVTGDFNAGESSDPVRYLKGGVPESPVRLIDTYRALHPDARLAGTYNGFKGGKTGEKIDYVLTLSDAKVLNARIIHEHRDGRYPSDHFPVTAEILFPDRRAATH